jgi:hypothetical protein
MIIPYLLRLIHGGKETFAYGDIPLCYCLCFFLCQRESLEKERGDQFLSFSLLPVQIVRFVYGKQKARKYEPFLSQTTSPLQQPLPCVIFLLQMRLRLVAASPHHVYVPL